MAFFIILLSALVMSGGFVVLHYSLTRHTLELKAAGWTLVVVGFLNIIGLLYYTAFLSPMPRPEYLRPVGGEPFQCHGSQEKIKHQ